MATGKKPVNPGKRRGRRPNISAEQLARETEQILSMRQAGASYSAIGRHLGLARETVYKRLKKELQDMPREQAAELRALEVLKLDRAEFQLQAGVKAGDVRSIGALVRISESRRKLLGLDMPEQHEVKISREEEALVDQLAAALTERDRREQQEDLP